jgi:uncharacterized protein YjiS (DUF1127 family)
MADISLDGALTRGGIAATFHRLRDTLAERARLRRIYHTTLAELETMSDRELADFGMHRSDLPRIAREAARKA